MEKTRLERELEEAQLGSKRYNWLIVILVACLIIIIIYTIHLRTKLDSIYREMDSLLLEKEVLQNELKQAEEELNRLKSTLRDGQNYEQQDRQ
ncbi:MAG: hypothetical protein GXO97_02745 [Nitrospirae bacterium]|nr:hypothetical protein [Nitrospirota bacterium]